MITLDTSAVLAIANGRDPDHTSTVDALRRTRGPYLVPAGILAEAAFMLDRRIGTVAVDAFLADLDSGAYSLDCGADDLARIRELVNRYADLPLGFADAAVVACAERSGRQILSLDRRDFTVVARDTKLELLPPMTS